MGSNKTVKGYNDLLTKNPSLAAEWNYKLNEGLKPDSIAYQSNKVVWWKCNTCGYEWKSTVNNRNKGNGCPCCSNQVVVSGVNDLLTKNKELTLDWNYEKTLTFHLKRSFLEVQRKCGGNVIHVVMSGRQWLQVATME